MNSQNQQFHAILQGCLQEHRESQKALYDLFYGLSMGICVRYARSEADAMEVVQDGFMKIFRHLPEFKYPKDVDALYISFRAWVKKIMVYSAIDLYRQQKNRMPEENLDKQAWQLASGGHHPLEKIAYEELIRFVQALSPGYRTVFNLYVIDGFSHEEIADKLGVTVGTSKSNLSKAKENLRQMLMKANEAYYAKYE